MFTSLKREEELLAVKFAFGISKVQSNLSGMRHEAFCYTNDVFLWFSLKKETLKRIMLTSQYVCFC